MAGSRGPSAGWSRLDWVLTGFLEVFGQTSRKAGKPLPVPEPLTRDRQDQKAGSQRRTKGLGLIMENCVGSCRDLSACYRGHSGHADPGDAETRCCPLNHHGQTGVWKRGCLWVPGDLVQVSFPDL